MVKLYAYKEGSNSAKALADALGIKRVRHEGKPLYMRGATLINWGAARVARDIRNAIVLNLPKAVAAASNKMEAFQWFSAQGVPCPDWTKDVQKAAKWLNEGSDVVRRAVLNGHSGAGISIHSQGYDIEDLKGAPLYTRYVKKEAEYRIHVFQGTVIFQQRKARKKDVPDDRVNWQVRNLAGGFIFAHHDVVAPENVQSSAIAAVQALGLDFGAVDVISNKAGQCFVLEVNTACGLEGTTLEKYCEQFRKFM